MSIFLGLVALLVLALAVNWAVGQNKNEDKIRIAYNNTSLTNASVIVAYEKGYFQKHGVSPEMIPLKSGKEVSQAILSSQADAGLGGLTNFITLMEKGAPIRFIAASAASPSYIFVRPDSQINNFSDLSGKNISVSALGINDLIFRTAMANENIDTNNMKFEEIDRDLHALALMEKKIVDAVVVSEQDTEGMYKAGAIILPEWQSKGYDKKAEPRNSLAINTDYLKANEKNVSRLLDALSDAHRLMNGKPQEAAALLANHIRKSTDGAVDHSVDSIVNQWAEKKTTNMIWQNPDITMSLAQKAQEIGIVEKELSLSDIFDLRFQSKLEKVQNEIYSR